MTTFADFVLRMRRLLDDLTDPENPIYTNEICFDGFTSALDALLPWFPKLLVSTSAIVGNGSTAVFVLPAGLYEVEAVAAQDDGEILSRAALRPGAFRGNAVGSGNDWIEYPSGSITFSVAPRSGVIYELFYSAEWGKPVSATDSGFVLETPNRYLAALLYWACAYALQPQIKAASNLGQYDTRIDSGRPEDNPLMRNAKWFLNLFELEVGRFAAHQRAQTS